MSNMEMLRKAEVGLDELQKQVLANYLLGGLAVLVPQEDWSQVLDLAVRYVAQKKEVTK